MDYCHFCGEKEEDQVKHGCNSSMHKICSYRNISDHMHACYEAFVLYIMHTFKEIGTTQCTFSDCIYISKNAKKRKKEKETKVKSGIL